MRDIRGYIKYLKKDPNTGVYSANYQDSNINVDEYFIESTYKDANDQSRKCYLITQKGCELAINKLKGEKGTKFTAQYVEAYVHRGHKYLTESDIYRYTK